MGVGAGKDEREVVFDESSGQANLKLSGRLSSSCGIDSSCDLRSSKK